VLCSCASCVTVAPALYKKGLVASGIGVGRFARCRSVCARIEPWGGHTCAQEALRVVWVYLAACMPRPDALSPPLSWPLRRAHNTRRYEHPFAGVPGLSGRGLRGVPAYPLLCGMGGIGAERGGMDARERDDTSHRGRGGHYIGHSPTAGTLGSCHSPGPLLR
jgi:hypothetical protein